jgi:uncharacterized protein YutE (UPF0331/DUF86 family)
MKQEIEYKLEQLQEQVSRLEQSQNMNLEELRKDQMIFNAVERQFQVAIEIVIDISSKINSYEGAKSPESYKESIANLSELGVLEQEFAEKFQNVASFRNVLVHFYADVDEEKVHKYLTEDLDDFKQFAESVAAYTRELEE